MTYGLYGTKLTISVPDEVAVEVRSAVRAGQASVSGYVVAAVEHYRQSMTLDEWLDQVDAELGPPSAEAFARVDAQLGLKATVEQTRMPAPIPRHRLTTHFRTTSRTGSSPTAVRQAQIAAAALRAATSTGSQTGENGGA